MAKIERNRDGEKGARSIKTEGRTEKGRCDDETGERREREGKGKKVWREKKSTERGPLNTNILKNIR